MKKFWKFIKTVYLCIRFPFLYHGSVFYCWFDAIPEGWRKSFGIQLFKEIKQSLTKEQLKSFKIYDIKEKYGELRIDAVGFTTEVQKIVMKYEYISRHTCIVCGRVATVLSTGWISPYCDNCLQSKHIYHYEDFGTEELPWYGYLGNINDRILGKIKN